MRRTRDSKSFSFRPAVARVFLQVNNDNLRTMDG